MGLGVAETGMFIGFQGREKGALAVVQADGTFKLQFLSFNLITSSRVASHLQSRVK